MQSFNLCKLLITDNGMRKLRAKTAEGREREEKRKEGRLTKSWRKNGRKKKNET